MDEVMTSEKGVPILVQSGVPREIAQEVVARIDRRMKQAMLRLYRSATNIGAEWHADVDAITSPGLVIWGAEDPFVPVRFGERLAQRVGAELLVFEQCGHWWPSQRPIEAARALERLVQVVCHMTGRHGDDAVEGRVEGAATVAALVHEQTELA
jgi:pimeloyl-ACP methyl ester carboxylesterase